MIGICKVCSKTFPYSPSNRSGKYCSRQCSFLCPEWREKQAAPKRGKLASQQTRRLMSLVRKGVPKPTGFGAKISASQRGMQHPWCAGERSKFWKGGVTAQQRGARVTKEYRRWRLAVLDRDGYACVWCGTTENLQVDHEIPFSAVQAEAQLCNRPDWIHDVDNGRILCQLCHKRTPSYARKTNKVLEIQLLNAIVACTPPGVSPSEFYQQEMLRQTEMLAAAL